MKRTKTDRRSGSETISMRPVPALFKSIDDTRLRGSNMVFPVSYDDIRKIEGSIIGNDMETYLFKLDLFDAHFCISLTELKRTISGQRS